MNAESVGNTSEILDCSETNTNNKQDQTKQVKKHPCPTCGKSFSRPNHLVIHERIHTGEKPYSCEICGKSFTKASELIKHERIHTGEKPFACGKCGKVFSQSSHLTGHKKTHTGEKPYPCDICEMSFSQIGGLTNHKRTHTGEKPYSCHICQKSFTRSSGLSLHKKRVHLKTKEAKNTDDDTDSNFIDCGEPIKHEIKIEVTIEEDPLSIQIEAVENIVNTEEMAFDEECRTEVKEEKDQDSLIVDCGEAINQQVKEELTDREIKQELEEEGINVF